MRTSRLTTLAVLGVAATGADPGAAAAAPAAPQTTRLAPYSQPLPLPAKAKPVAPNTYRLSLRQFSRRMHPKLAATRMWGYDDGSGAGPSSPGPVIEVQKGTPTSVTYTNDLPVTHLFGIDPALTMGDLSVRTMQHLHGGFISGAADGNPFQTPMPEPRTQAVSYANQQNPTLLWYHDHALGLTRLNPYAGLAGPYVIRDANDTGAEPNPLGIPGDRYELPLVIQDKQFDRLGQLFYPPPPWVPESFGNETVVNGAVEPYVDVEPRRYRMRLLNGSNARFYNLEFATPAGTAIPFDQIGAELGLFDRPQRVTRSLLLPAERADTVIDFSAYRGQTLTLRNAALPKGVVSPGPRLPTVMQIRVGTTVTKPGPGPVPATLPGERASAGAPTAPPRNLTLEEQLDPAGNPIRLLIDGKPFDAPVSETPAVNSTEEWRFVNMTVDSHPMHLHLAKFEVAARYKVDLVRYGAAVAAARAAGRPTPDPMPFAIGGPLPANPAERGWKDTVAANPGEITAIRTRWDLPAGVTGPQKYVFHCHILEHEENDMMRPIRVG